MRKVIVNEWMSLDGVVQAPGAADEDTTGGFEHGGWHLRYFDDLSRRWVAENLTGAGGFLLGPHLRELRGPLAEGVRGGAVPRPASEHAAKVRGVNDTRRATRVAELKGAPGRSRHGRGRAEAGERQ